MAKRSNWDLCASLERLFPKRSSEEGSHVYLREIARGGAISFLGLAFSSAANFVFQIILTRALGSSGAGLFNLGFTIASLMGIFALLGLDRGAVRYIAYYQARQDPARELGVIRDASKIVGVVVLLLTPVLWGSAGAVASTLFRKPDLGPVLQVFILCIPLIALTRLWMGVLQGYKRILLAVSIEQLIVSTLRIIGLIVVVYLIAGTAIQVASSFFYATLIGAGLAALVVWRYYQERKKTYKPIRVSAELLSFSWPLMFVGILNRTNTYTETLVLGALSTSEQVGFYTVCFKVAATLVIFFEATNLIFGPFITEAFSRGDVSMMNLQYKTVTRWSFTLTLPVVLLVLMEAPAIMQIFGAEFVAGAPILQLLAVSQLVYASFGPAMVTLTMMGHSRLNLIDLVLTLALSLVLDFILISRYGAYGAALAGAITIVFVNLLRLGQVYAILHMHPFDADIFKPILAGGVSIVLTLGLHTLEVDWFYLWRMIATGMFSLSCYGLTLVVLQAFKRRDQFSGSC